MDFTALARQASVGDGSELSGDAVHRFGELVAGVAKAKEREAHDYTKGKLAGALAALRQLQECVPPKDWKRYASEVLALDARDRERSNDVLSRRNRSEETMERKKLDALLMLAGIEPVAVHELANKYWPDCDAYAQIRRDNPWWLVLTQAGPVVIGWRKRVISINWEGTAVRGKMTADDTTSELGYCHAWTYAKAVEYLSTLQSALRLATQNVAEPQAA